MVQRLMCFFGLHSYRNIGYAEFEWKSTMYPYVVFEGWKIRVCRCDECGKVKYS